MKWRNGLLALAFLALAFSCRAPGPDESESTPPTETQRPTEAVSGFSIPDWLPTDIEKVEPPTDIEDVVVAKIVDGDTFDDEGGRRYRLIGIDTPEDGEIGDFEAAERLRRLIQGRKVRIEVGKTALDAYGRTLAYVWMDDPSGRPVMMNQILVREGFASYFPFRDNPRYLDELWREQEKARKEGIRVWTLPVKSEPSGQYVASTGDGAELRFHRPDCSSAKQISERNRRVYSSRDEALADKRSPCRKCKP